MNSLRMSANAACLMMFLSSVSFGQHPEPTIGHQIPVDVTFSGGEVIASFDDFSWQQFIALNWPARAGSRGEPDTTRKLGEAAPSTVWETWKADYEIFQPNGDRPEDWDSYKSSSPCAAEARNQGKSLLSWGGDVNGLAIPHFNQAGIGTPIGSLAAQNETFVRYEIRVNRTEFEFIRGNNADTSSWLHLRKNLPGENQPSLVFPAGSVELKAAWREFKLPEEEPLLSRYHTREALVVNADGHCETKTMGLIGLHIVHRTPTMREWVWSTFEHVDNLSDTDPDFSPSLTDPGGIHDPNHPDVNRLRPVVNPGDPLPAATPVQVVRVLPIHTSTRGTNRLYRSHPDVRDTVWANYRLVMTQWPTMPAPDDQTFRDRLSKPTLIYPEDAGFPSPDESTGMPTTAISNASMETTGVFQRAFSCMNCHLRRSSDSPRTEFSWFLRLRAYPSDGEDAQKTAASLQELARGLISERQ